MWCQGFSEPGTGSDLSSLSCRATPSNDHWVINGQKLSRACRQCTRCVLLTRTGPPGSAHRGITAFFVDIDTPGITVRPFEIMNGAPEFAEVFFDEAVVPGDRILGEVNGGWAVAMNILPFERSTSFWHRTAFLANRLQQLVERSPDDVHRPRACSAKRSSTSMRCRSGSRLTQYRLAEQGTIGAETSVDKILVATAEQQLFDAARELLPGVVELDDSPDGEHWRSDYLYSARRPSTAARPRSSGTSSPGACSTRTGGVDGDAVEARPDGRDAATESTVGDGDAVEAWPDGRDAATESTPVDGSRRARASRQERASHAGVGARRRRCPRSHRLVRRPRRRPGRDAVSVVLGALGELNAVASSLDDVMLDGLGVGAASGGALALPPFGRWEPPGTLHDGALEIDGLALARVTRRETIAVPTRDGDAVVLAIVPRDGVTRTPVSGLSPELGISRLPAAALHPAAIETVGPGGVGMTR